MGRQVKNENGLTDKQQLFVDYYLANGNNATQAYKQVYKRASDSTAKVNSCKMLEKTEISAYIDKRMQEIQEKTQVKQEWVVQHLKEVAERCMQHEPVMYYDKYDKEYKQEKVELYDENGNYQTDAGVYKFDSIGANKALETLAKTLGMLTDKVDVNDNKSTDKLDSILKQLANKKVGD